MSKFEFFSPAEVVKTYFEEFAGSLQNKSHSKALKYARKVSELRNYFSIFLGIQDTHLTSVQFNQYYINRIIFKYLKVDSTWVIYSDNSELKNEAPDSEIQPIDNLLHSTKEMSKNKSLIWISNSKKINLELFEAVRKFQENNREFPCYTFLSLDYLLYSAPKISSYLREFSFLVFNPSKLFQEYGVLLFSFRKELKLEPVIMGSNASIFNKETKNIEIRELPHSLESGTQNVISLIILERFFYFLNTEKNLILSRLKNPFLNFNLSENLNPK